MTSHGAKGIATKINALGFEQHDHSDCVEKGMAVAEVHCAQKGLRFTSVRQKALEILLQEHRALGAYEVLDRLKEAGFGSQPPVAYRALDFLVENGFAHKIEKLNAFIACANPGTTHSPAFMICRECDSVAETHLIPARAALGDVAKAAGFVIEKAVVEAEGLCPTCVDKDVP